MRMGESRVHLNRVEIFSSHALAPINDLRRAARNGSVEAAMAILALQTSKQLRKDAARFAWRWE